MPLEEDRRTRVKARRVFNRGSGQWTSTRGKGVAGGPLAGWGGLLMSRFAEGIRTLTFFWESFFSLNISTMTLGN